MYIPCNSGDIISNLLLSRAYFPHLFHIISAKAKKASASLRKPSRSGRCWLGVLRPFAEVRPRSEVNTCGSNLTPGSHTGACGNVAYQKKIRPAPRPRDLLRNSTRVRANPNTNGRGRAGGPRKMASLPETAELYDALSVLSWDEFQVFATYLGKGVDLPTLKRIEHDHGTTGSRILHSIQAWLDYDFEVSWEKVVFALRKIGKNADAERLQSLYYPEVTSHDSLPLCSPESTPQAAHTTTADTLPEASKDQLDICSPALIQSPSPDATSVIKAAAQAAELSEKFMNVLSKAKIQLINLESESTKFLTEFRTVLTTLPVCSKYKHLTFLKEEKPALKAASDVDEIFDVIEPYMTHSDYSLLKYIIATFCNEDLQKMMNSYILELEEFEKTTTVHDAQNIKHRETIPNGTKRVVIRTRLPPTVCTLYNVRQVREAIADEAALEPYAHLQLDVHASAVTIVLAFPQLALSLVAQAMTTDFLLIHDIESVSINEKPLQSYIEEVSKKHKCLATCPLSYRAHHKYRKL